MRRSHAPIPALLILALAALPAAADVSPDSTRARGMTDTVTVLKPVEVRQDRTPQAGRTTGTTVRIDRSRLVRFAPSFIGDVVNAIPGVDVSHSGAWSSQVSMRGLAGERVAVMVDGVRLDTGRGHGAQTSLVSMDRIEAVEAQPGTGSAVNGSDALAGTLELITHRTLFAERRAATLTLSARGTDPGGEQAEFGRLRWLSRDFGAELSGSVSQLGGIAAAETSYAHSGYRDQDLTARVAGRVGVVTLDAEHSAHRGYHVELPVFQNSLGATASFPLISRDADRVELSSPAQGRRPALRLLGVVQQFQTNYDETDVAAIYQLRRLQSYSTDVWRHRVPMTSRSLQPSAQFGALRVFGEYRDESTSGPANREHVVTRVGTGAVTADSMYGGEAIPPARRTIWGVGTSTALTPLGFRVEGGLRWDWMHSLNDSTAYSITAARDLVDQRVSGEAGLSRTIGAWTPYVHVAKNFRAPNLEERFAHMMVHGSLYVLGNAALRPEVARTTEVGVRVPELAGGHVTGVRLSAYRTEAEDLISIKYSDVIFGVPWFEYRNLHRARLEGLEAQGDLRAGSVVLGMGAAFPRGVDTDTHEPVSDLGASRATFDLRLPMPAFVRQGTLSLRAQWTNAARTAVGEDLLARPAYWTGAVEAGTTLLGARWTLSVRNVTNQRYMEPLSLIYAPGRAVSLSARRDLPLNWLTFARER